MNPWTALMQPLVSRPGDVPRKPPRAASRTHSADGYTVRPAAAVVVTETSYGTDIHLVPVIALEFL